MSSEILAPCNSSKIERSSLSCVEKIFSSVKVEPEAFLVWAVLVQILGRDVLFAIILLQSSFNYWEYISCRLLEFPSIFWMDDLLSSIRCEHESLIVCTVVLQSSGEDHLSFPYSMRSSTFNTWEHTSPKQTDLCLPQTSFFSDFFFFLRIRLSVIFFISTVLFFPSVLNYQPFL